MSPEAAARLAEAKLREELLGRVEGQYKLRGETPAERAEADRRRARGDARGAAGERAAGDEWWWA